MRDDEASLQFKATAEKLGIAHLVEFIQETPARFDCFDQFDVFALTSWEESASLASLENMLLGTPVVYFEGSGGAAEFIGDGGVAVAGFSPTDMAVCLHRLSISPLERSAMGERGRARVGAHFLQSQQMPKIFALMSDLAGAAKRRAV